MVHAQAAYRIGLVNEVVPAAELIARCEAILKQILANAPLAVRFALEAVNKGMETSLSAGLLLEASVFSVFAGTEDKREGNAAFLENRISPLHGPRAKHPTPTVKGNIYGSRQYFLLPESGA